MWSMLLGALLGFISLGYLSALPVAYIVVALFVLFLSLLLLRFVPANVCFSSIILQVIIFCCAFVAAAGYANLKLDHYLAAKLTQPLLADAVVNIEQISDATGDNFRQVAVIKRLFLTDNQAVAWQTNPFYVRQQNMSRLPTSSVAITNKFSHLQLPARVLLRAGYRLSEADKQQLDQLQPGQIWYMRLQLTPIQAPVVAGGFDKARWLMQLNVVAEGSIEKLYQHQQANTVSNWRVVFEKKRYQLRQQLQQLTQNPIYQQDQAVLLGLLTGDRSQINTQTKQLYQHMGISHLLAISGPHVLFAALIGGVLLAKVLMLFPSLLRVINREKWVLSFASLLTLAYALLAGFDVPAQRTCATLILFTLLTYFNLNISRWQLLGLTAVMLLVYDPIAITQAGFWLSFVAVALLQHYASSQQLDSSQDLPQASVNFATPTQHQYSSLVDKLITKSMLMFKHLFKLQLWLFLALLPLTAWFFGQVSFIAPMSNLLAIPIISLGVVPLNLMAAVLYGYLPWLAELFWWLALWFLHGLHVVLQELTVMLPSSVFSLQLSLAELLLVGFIGWCWSLLRGVFFRLALLPLGVAWFVSVFLPRITVAPAVLTVLDTGRGLTVLLQSQTAHWLFLADRVDTKNESKNRQDEQKRQPKQQRMIKQANMSTNQTLLPVLQAYNVPKLTGLVVLNNSAFSQQQAVSLQASLPILNKWVSGEHTGVIAQPCVHGQLWQNEVISISSLSGWQTVNMPENDRTCLVLIAIKQPQVQKRQRILLVPQHSQISQQMLVALCQTLAVDMLIVDGHAALDRDWLAQTQPQQAIFTNNEWSYGAGRNGQTINSHSLGLTSAYAHHVWLTTATGTLQFYLADKNKHPAQWSKQQARWYQ